MGRRNLDIHHYDVLYIKAEQHVRAAGLSDRNTELILRYRDVCLLKGLCGRVRLIRVLGALVLFARLGGSDFERWRRRDVEDLVSRLLAREPSYSPETIGTYKAILKNFLSWVLDPDHFPSRTPPEAVAWLRCHVRSRDKKRLERRDLLTPADIERLLTHAHHSRDKALLSMLWETGGRIAEVGNLQLKHATRVEHGYTLDVTGKTGGRCPIIVSSAPHLTIWLQHHPFTTDPESPLWCHHSARDAPRHLSYATIRSLLRRTFQRAGITKPFHPHLFRHSRATWVLATGLMNESQAKAYFGWTPGSHMLSTYAHLIDQDANDAILRENHLTVARPTTSDLTPTKCPRCQEFNPPRAPTCSRCTSSLDPSTAFREHDDHRANDTLLLGMFELLVEKGLVNEAVSAVHAAGMGEALARLAARVPNGRPQTLPAPPANPT